MSWAEELAKSNPSESKDVKNKMFDAKYNKMIQRANHDPNITHKIRKSVYFRLRNDEHDAIIFLEEIRTKPYLLIQEFFKLI